MKKVIALTLMLLMMLMLVSTVGFAAKSSSGSRSFSSPKQSTTSGYKPTAPAGSYSNTAPAKQTTPGVQQTTSQSGGFLRNAGMFGGGMLAGSMLGSLFGYGNMGGGSSIFGMLLNILIIGGIVMGIRNLWNRYKNRNRHL